MPEISHKKQLAFRCWALALKTFVFFPPMMVCFLLGSDIGGWFGSEHIYSWSDFGTALALCVFVVLFALLFYRLLALYEKKHPRKVVELDREVLQQAKQTRFDAITFLTLLAYLLSAALCLGVSVWVYGWLTGLMAGLVLYFCWIHLFRSAEKNYTGLVSMVEYVVTGGIYLAGFIAVFLIQLVYQLTYFPAETVTLSFGIGMEPLVLAFAVYTVSMGFLLNQSNLDRTMESMKHSKASLPQKIRLYNMFLVGAVMALLVVGFFFRDQILGFLAWAGKTLLYIFLMGISYLIKLLTMGPSISGGEDGTPEINPGESVFQAAGNPFWDLILLVLLLGLVVFLLSPPGRRLLKRIISLPKKAIQALCRWVSPKMRENMASESQEYYTDHEEDLLQTMKTGKAKRGRKQSLKKRLKEWRKLTDPVQKIRTGYSLLRNDIEIREPGITPADTVREAEKKVRLKPYFGLFTENGALYEQVRYGEKEPDLKDVSRFSQDVEQFFSSRQK